MISDPDSHTRDEKRRAEAYERLPLFPNVKDWCIKVKAAGEQLTAAAEVAIVALEKTAERGDTRLFMYIRTRSGFKITLKNDHGTPAEGLVT